MVIIDQKSIVRRLESSGSVEFKRHERSKDYSRHKAVVDDGLIIVDGTLTLTWDSFIHFYLEGYVEREFTL